MVYPHRILAYLFDEVGLQIPSSDVQQYWNHAREMGEPWACQHPASENHIPLGLHGDAARLWTIYKTEKILGVWLNLPLFRPKSVRHSRWLLFSIAREKLIKNRTLNPFWRKLVWSLNAAFTGLNPVQGPGGQPLIGTHADRAGSPICKSRNQFALTELRGDWEWHRDIWRFTASWQGQDVCFKCPAVTRGDGDDSYVYYNNGLTSRWLQEEFSLNAFVACRLKDHHLCAQAHE